MHRLQLQVLVAADGLGDRGVEDVGADRGHRRDAEDQDQERRHQGRAAHAGHADEQADAEAEDDDRWIHAVRSATGGQATVPAALVPTLLTVLGRASGPRDRSESASALEPGLGVVQHRVDLPGQVAAGELGERDALEHGAEVGPHRDPDVAQALGAARRSAGPRARISWMFASGPSTARITSATVISSGRGEPVAAARAALRPGPAERASARAGCARGTAAGSPALSASCSPLTGSPVRATRRARARLGRRSRLWR